MPKVVKESISTRTRRALIKVKRVPEATIVKPDGIVTLEGVEKWHRELCDHLKEKNHLDILEHSKRIFNLKEIHFPMVPSHPASPYVTTLVVVSASGVLVPPTVFFPNNSELPPMNINGEETHITIEDSNTRDKLMIYLEHIFHPWLLSENIGFPVGVFIDCLDMPTEILRFCKKNQIILLDLAPTVESLHPIKSRILHPLQRNWIAELLNWKQEHTNEDLHIELAPRLLERTFEKTITVDRLKKAFQKSGIFPFSPVSVYKHRMACLLAETSPDLSAESQEEIETIDMTQSNQSSPDRLVKSHPVVPKKTIRISPDSSVPHAVSQLSNSVSKMTQTARATLLKFPSLLGPLVYEFKNATNCWNGAIENTALFYVWQKLPTPYQSSSAHHIIDQQFRIDFERLIGPLVYEFKNVSGTWPGAIENTALFEVWHLLASIADAQTEMN